jgi:hypothetical protein
LAVWLRVKRALWAPWYWDEGYLTEWAMDLAAGQAGHAGALWQNGLLPLTTSLLAPLSAAPFIKLLPVEALLAVRIWAAVLSGISALLLGLIGRRLERPGTGLFAAALFAAAPLPLALGALGIYHHLACALVLAAYWLWLRDGKEAWAPYALAGLALAACYWLLWLPLGLVLAAGWSRRTQVRWLALGLPSLLAAAWTFSHGAELAWAMAKVLRGYEAPGFGFKTVSLSIKGFPLAWTGLLGLLLLPRGKRWPAWAFLGLLDAVRQRGDLSGSPYVLTPLMPWACLGLALVIQRCWERSRALGALVCAGGVIVAGVGSFEWIQRLSVPPEMGRELATYIAGHAEPDDTVLATPSVDWLLRRSVRPVELAQAGSRSGLPSGFIPAACPPEAFAYDPSLEHARYFVVSRVHFDGLFLDEIQALTAFQAESEGWPLERQNAWFKVYANPRFGAKKDPKVRILHDPVFYVKAAKGAARAGRHDLEALALERARAGFQP